jgi:predicted Holliday junction resolvase-like endonuclease
LLSDFPYALGDARFLGSPIDYIIFEGYGAVQGRRADLLESVVFLEIKYGSADLTLEERRIRDCVDAGRVRWEMMRVSELPQESE